MVETSETEYEVEQLVGYRHEDDHFLVKWDGYSTNNNTWEPKGALPAGMVAAWVGHCLPVTAWLQFLCHQSDLTKQVWSVVYV